MQQELPSATTGALAQTRSTYGGNNVVTARPYMREAQAMVDAGGLPQSTSTTPLSFLHYPIAPGGMGVLDDGPLRALVLDIIAYMRAGEYIYLHCGDGNGRSGTVAAVVLGLTFGLGPVEAMALMQKSRNDRAGAQGPAPETHEQRMQVHRLLSDKSLRQAASAVSARHPDPLTTETSTKLTAVLTKIRAIVAKKGAASLIYLKRYAAKLAGTSSASFGNVVSGSLSRSVFDKLCSDAEWYLTPEESDTLWNAAAAASAGGTTGTIDVPSLFRVIRGILSPRRAGTVHDAFARLNAGPGGAVSLDKFASAFQAAQHPDVKANRKKVEDVTAEFLDTFGVQARTERAGSHGAIRSVSS